MHDLRRIHVLLVQSISDTVHQTLDAFFYFDEAAVVGDVRDLPNRRVLAG